MALKKQREGGNKEEILPYGCHRLFNQSWKKGKTAS